MEATLGNATEVADRIKIALESGGYGETTQVKIAEVLGISPQSLNNILKARDLPRLETAVKMCRLFKCDLEWLATGKPSKQIVSLS